MHGARRRPDTTLATWWDGLQLVWQRQDLSPTGKLVFGWLSWHSQTDTRKVTVSTAGLGAACGVRRETAGRALHELAEANLVAIAEWGKRDGVVSVYMIDPRQGIREKLVTEDPQRRLFPEEQVSDADADDSLPTLALSRANRRDQIYENGHAKPGRRDQIYENGHAKPGRRDQIYENGHAGVTECAKTVTPSLSTSRKPLVDRRSSIDDSKDDLGSTVDSSIDEGEEDDHRDTDWETIVEDAKRVARKLWPRRDWGKDPLSAEDHSLILKASALARVQFSEHWLAEAVEGVLITKPRNPAAYLHRSLANKCLAEGTNFNHLLAAVKLPAHLLKPKGERP